MPYLKGEFVQLMLFENEDCLLDVPFVTEEVDTILRKLKSGKSPGQHKLQAEHLRYGGPIYSPGLDPANMQCNHRT